MIDKEEMLRISALLTSSALAADVSVNGNDYKKGSINQVSPNIFDRSIQSTKFPTSPTQSFLDANRW